MANNQNLKPWKPGHSGNLSGRPKGVPSTKMRYRRLLNLVNEVKNPMTGELEEFSLAEVLDMQIIAKALKGDVRAYKEIMNRLEGPPTPIIDYDLKREQAQDWYDENFPPKSRAEQKRELADWAEFELWRKTRDKAELAHVNR
jgi:hypothetical protein